MTETKGDSKYINQQTGSYVIHPLGRAIIYTAVLDKNNYHPKHKSKYTPHQLSCHDGLDPISFDKKIIILILQTFNLDSKKLY